MKRRREEDSQASGSKQANTENLVRRNSMSSLKPDFSHDAERPESQSDVSESKTSIQKNLQQII